jgi:hypothetical protein
MIRASELRMPPRKSTIMRMCSIFNIFRPRELNFHIVNSFGMVCSG